ncbi:MAG: DM13 domain-containing protein [Pseudomonadota bacterium]
MNRRNVILSAVAASLLSAGAIASPAFADYHAAMSEAAGQTLYSGQWTKKSFKVSGDWSIIEKDGKTYIKLSSDFRTRNAPDLKIFLSPLAASETNGSNATQGSVLVAPLTSNSGAQTYEIPEGVDLSSFQSVLIHCEQFSKLWSAADLA